MNCRVQEAIEKTDAKGKVLPEMVRMQSRLSHAMRDQAQLEGMQILGILSGRFDAL